MMLEYDCIVINKTTKGVGLVAYSSQITAPFDELRLICVIRFKSMIHGNLLVYYLFIVQFWECYSLFVCSQSKTMLCCIITAPRFLNVFRIFFSGNVKYLVCEVCRTKVTTKCFKLHLMPTCWYASDVVLSATGFRPLCMSSVPAKAISKYYLFRNSTPNDYSEKMNLLLLPIFFQ